MAVGCFVFAAIVIFYFVASSGSKGLPAGSGGSLTTTSVNRDYAWLARHGVAAQGVLLQVSPTRDSKTSSGSLTLERRSVVIDIEVPGDPPYEVKTSIEIPSQLSEGILPGAIVELRVDPKNVTQVMIFGPGVGLPLAPFAKVAPVRSVATSPAPALAVASATAAAPIVGDEGMGKCSSCGALVSLAGVRKHGNSCTTCGASWG